MYLRYKYAEPLQPIPGKIPTKFDEDKELLRQQRFQKAVKLVIQFLYGFAFAYEKAKKIESSYETLRLATFLGKSVLFDDTDDFLKFIAKLENELNTRVTAKAYIVKYVFVCMIYAIYCVFISFEVYETSRGNR